MHALSTLLPVVINSIVLAVKLEVKRGKALLLTPHLASNSFMPLTDFCLDTADNSLTPAP